MRLSIPRIFLASLFFSAAAFAASNITGTITNGTSGKPAAGEDVIVFKLQGGMAEETRAKTDSQGKYSLSVENGGAPHVVRVEHQGVTYNQPAPPGTQSLDMKVYDVEKQVAGINASVDVMWIESDPGAKDLRVAQMIVVKNASNPPRSQFSEKAYEFYLPANAVIDSSDATSPGGIPIKAPVIPQSEKGHFSFAFPIRPGETRFQIAYHLPYTGTFNFAPKVLYAVDHVAVFLPKSMQFKAEGSSFQPMKDESGSEMQVATGVKSGQQLNFEVSGYGALPREEDKSASGPDANTADGRAANNLPGGGLGRPEEAPDALHDARWYVLGGLAVLLGAGAFFMMRAPQSHPATANAAPADRSALLLEALKEEMFQLEADRIKGKVPQSEYEKAKSGLDAALRRAIGASGK